MMAVRSYVWISFIFITLLLCLFAEAKAQRGMPPLDFEQFRRDVAVAQSPQDKLEQYLEATRRVMRFHPDSLFVFAEEIGDLQGIEQVKKKAFENYILARAWHYFNTDSAIYYNIKAESQLKRINQHKEYLDTKNLLGLEYRSRSDYLNAEETYLGGLNYSQSLDSTYYPVHFFYGNLGNLYSAVGANSLAVKMFEKFMEFADNPGDKCNIVNRLAKNLMEMKEFEKADLMLSPCLEFTDLPIPIRAIVRSNLSEIAGKMGQADRSLALMEEAAAISSNYRIPNLHIVHLVRLGNYYLDRNRIQQADSIRTIINGADFRGHNRHFTIEKALFFSDLALANGNYKNTIAYADSAIQLANGNEDLKQFLGKVYTTKAKAYEKLGKMDFAVENYRLQDELEEVQLAKEKVKSEAMMKVRYQFKQKEDQLALVSNRLNILNERYLFLLALVLMVGLTGGFIYSRYRKSRLNEEKAVAELQQREVTISELEQKVEQQNRKLKERNNPEWVELTSQVKLSLNEIRYIQSDGNYVKIFLADVNRAPIMERLTLKRCEEMLPDEITVRIHRSTVVNIRHVSHISNEILFLKDNTELKISRRYRKDLVDFLACIA